MAFAGVAAGLVLFKFPASPVPLAARVESSPPAPPATRVAPPADPALPLLVQEASPRRTFYPDRVEIGSGEAGLTLALAHVMIGGRRIDVPGATPRLNPGDVSYERGAVLEKYVSRGDVVEQIFVLDRSLASRRGDGDLVIALDLSTSRRASVRREGLESKAVVEFLDAAGGEPLVMGAATAIDAGGRTWPLAYDLKDRRLEMRLPAEALAGADFPLTVDPLIGNALYIETSSNRNLEGALSHHAATGDYLAVFEDLTYNTPASDVFARVVSPIGVVSSRVALDNSGEDSRRPRVARSSGASHLAVWQERAGSGPWSIKGRLVTLGANGPVLAGPEFAVSTGPEGTRPDVGYSVSDDSFLVVWESAADILGARVSTSGVVSASFAITATGDVEEKPSVTTARAGSLGVAWVRRVSTGAQGDIYAASVDAAIPSVSAAVAVSADPLDEDDVDLGGDGGPAFAVWSRTSGGGGSDVHGRRTTFGAGGPVLGVAFAVAAAATHDARPRCEAATSAGLQRLVVAYGSNPTFPPTSNATNVITAVFDAASDPPSLLETLTLDGTSEGNAPFVAVHPTGLTGLAGWESGSSSFDRDLQARRLSLSSLPVMAFSSPSVALAQVLGGSNPSGGFVLYNVGGGTLNWTATDDAPWLTVTASGSTASNNSSSVFCSASLSGLSPGVHTATVTVSDPAAPDSPRVLPVRLTIVGIAWTSPPVGPVSGGQTLSYSWSLSMGAATASQNDVRFGESSPSNGQSASNQPGGTGSYSGSAPAPVVSIPRTYLYAPHVVVDGFSLYGPTVSVAIQPPAGPVLSMNQSSLEFSAQEGGPASFSSTLSLSSVGAGPLTWTSNSSQPWLFVGPPGGTLPSGSSQTLTVWIDASTLAAGTHSGVVSVVAPGALNSPKTVAVTVNVPAIAWVLPPADTYSSGDIVFASWTIDVGTVNPSNAFHTLSYGPTNVPNSGSGSQTGGSGTYSWSFSAPSVSAPTIYFVAPSAQLNGLWVRGPAKQIMIHPRSQISLNPLVSMAFTVTRGGAAPASRALRVQNALGGVLNWTAVSSAPWVSVVPSSGALTAGQRVDAAVVVDPSGLSAGDYAATLTVSAPGALNSPQTTPVSLTVVEVDWVTPPPGAVESGQPISVAWSVAAGSASSTRNAVFFSTVNPPWGGSGSADQPGLSGVYSAVLQAPAALVPTTYYFAPVVHVGGDAHAGPIVPVVVNPASLPVISASPASITFATLQGAANPPDQTLTLANEGSGTLSWTAAEGAGWLSVSPPSGSLGSGASTPLALSADVSGLAVGTYEAVLQISSGAAANSPRSIPVTLVVQARPVIQLTGGPIVTSAKLGAAGLPSKTLTLRNEGGAVLSAAVSDDAPWLTVSPGAASLASAASTTLTLSMNATGLATGDHVATITVADPTASPPTATASVTLTVVSTAWVTPPAGPYVSGQTFPVAWTFQGGSGPATVNCVRYGTSSGSLFFSSAEQPGPPGAYAGTVTAPAASTPTLMYFAPSVTVAGLTHFGPVVSALINPAPLFTVNQTQLTFAAAQGGAAPAGQTVMIQNTGATSLNWSASESASWLSVAPASGTLATSSSQFPTFSVNPTGLSAGTYTEPVTLSDPAAVISRTVNVTFHVVDLTWVAPPASAVTSGEAMTYTWNVACGSGTVTSTYSSYSKPSPPTGANTGNQTGPSGAYSATIQAPHVTAPEVWSFRAQATVAGGVFLQGPIASVTVSPAPGPRVKLDPAPSFSAVRNGSNPATKWIGLFNPGSAPLNWTATDDAAWLTLGTTSGTLASGAGVNIMLNVNIAGLPAGVHTATLQVSDPAADNSPASATVTLLVGAVDWITPPAASYVSGETISVAWNLELGSTPTTWNRLNFGLSNPPNSGTPDQPGSSGVYSASAVAPVVAVPTTYYFQAMAFGGLVQATSPAVAVLINPTQPTIGGWPDSLSFVTALDGPVPSAQSVSVMNAGGGTLAWSATETAPWLTVSPASGSLGPGASAQPSVSVVPGGLAAGTHTTTIQIAAAGASNSPRAVVVTLTVLQVVWTTPPPSVASNNQVFSPAWELRAGLSTATLNRIHWSPSNPPWNNHVTTNQPGGSGAYSDLLGLSASTTPYYLGVEAVVGGVTVRTPVLSMNVDPSPASIEVTPADLVFAAPPVAVRSKFLTLRNPGSTALAWSLSSTAGWLSATPPAGTLSPSASTSIVVRMDSAGLPLGTSTASLVFTDPAASNSPLNVQVSLHVLGVTWVQAPSGPLASGAPVTLAWAVSAGDSTAEHNNVHYGPTNPPRHNRTENQPGPSGQYGTTLTAPSVAADTTYFFRPHLTVAGESVEGPLVSILVTATTSALLDVEPKDLAFIATPGGPDPAPLTLTISNVGQGSGAWSVSDDVSWLSVSPTTGTSAAGASQTVGVSASAAGLPVGVYRGRITVNGPTAPSSPLVVPVTLTVAAAAAIDLAPSAVAFQATAGGLPPSARTVTLRNTGGRTLAWSLTDDATWLSAAPASGVVSAGGSQTFAVSIDATGLATGPYAGTITVTDPAASNSPMTLSVDLTVGGPGACVSVDPPRIDAVEVHSFSFYPFFPAFTVTNTGTAPMTATLTKSVSWISLSASTLMLAPGGSQRVTFSFVTSSMPLGPLAGSVTITSADAWNSPVVLPITVDRPPIPPTLSLDPASLRFEAAQGGSAPPARVIHLGNAGLGSSSWTAASSAPWLSVNPPAGVIFEGGALLEVSADPAGLAAGTYEGTLTFTFAEPTAVNSPLTLPVTLVVGSPGPYIDVDDTALRFAAAASGPSPADRTVALTNRGTAPLAWTASGNGHWLSVSPSAGTLAVGASETLSIRVDSSALAPGTYTDWVSISDPTAANSPRTVPVTLDVLDVVWISPPGGTYASYGPISFTWAVLGGTSEAVFSGVRYSTANPPSWTSSSAGTASAPPGNYSATFAAPAVPAATATTYYFAPMINHQGLVIQGPIVSVLVQPAALLSLDATSFAFADILDVQPVPSQSFLVSNDGSGPLSWAVTDDASWLSAYPPGGVVTPGADQSVVVIVDATGLAPGTYTASITVTDAASPNPPKKVAVTLTVASITWVAPPLASYVGGETISVSWAVAADAPSLSTRLRISEFNPPSDFSGTVGFHSGTSGLFTSSFMAPILSSSRAYFLMPEITLPSFVTLRGPVHAFTILAPTGPVLRLNPTSLTLVAAPGGGDPVPATVQLSNLTSLPSTWSVADDASWLSVNPPSGTLAANASVTLTLTASLAGLPVGTHAASVTVTDPAAVNPPLSLPVTLRSSSVAWITPPPASALKNTPIPVQWSVSAAPGATGTTFVRYSTFNPPSASSGQRTADQAVGAGPYSATLDAPGVYVTEVYYYQPFAILDGVTFSGPVVPVTISPPAQPAIGTLESFNLNFTVLAGQPGSFGRQLYVPNRGSGTLNWTATESSPWMSLSPATGASTPFTSSSTTISVDATGLAPGAYTADVTVTDPAALDSPQTATVSLTVVGIAWTTPPPATVVGGQPFTVSWTLQAPPGSIAGGNSAYFSPSNPPWTSVSTAFQPGGPGGYSATLVAPNVAAATPYYVGVRAYFGLELLSPVATISVSPGPAIGTSAGPLAFSATQFGPPPSAQTLTVTNTGGGTLTWNASSAAPWLDQTPAGGTLVSGASVAVTVSIGSTALPPGVYPASVVVDGYGSFNGPVLVPVQLTIAADTGAPAVAALGSAALDGAYGPGAALPITVVFTEPVRLTGGSLRVDLDTGGVVTFAPFGPALSATGTYTVAAGQNSGDLTAVGPLVLLGGALLRDLAGNDAVLSIPSGSNLGVVKQIIIDTAAPAVAVTQPTGTGAFSTGAGLAALGGSASDPSGVAAVSWSNAANGLSGAAGGTETWTASVPLAVGVNAITLTATDAAGNSASDVVTVTRNADTEAPAIAASGATDFVTAVSIAALSGTSGDNVGVVAVTWANETTGTGGLASPGWSASVPLKPGLNRVRVRAWDAAGNVSTIVYSIQYDPLDTTPPLLTVTTPASPVVGATPVTLGGAVSDAGGVASLRWINQATGVEGAAAVADPWTADVPLAAGANPLTVTATDAAGNATSVTLVVTFAGPADATPPDVVITSPTDAGFWTSTVSPLPLGGTAADGVGVASVRWFNATTGGRGTAAGTAAWSASVALAPGLNMIEVTARDPAGNAASAWIDVSFVPPLDDSVAPLLFSSEPPVLSTPGPTMSLSGTADDDGGVVAVVWSNAATGETGSVEGSFAWTAEIPLAPGVNPITVTAFDAEGNVATLLFTVSRTSGGGGSGGGGGGGGGCGLTGLELPLLALAWRARKKSRRARRSAL